MIVNRLEKNVVCPKCQRARAEGKSHFVVAHRERFVRELWQMHAGLSGHVVTVVALPAPESRWAREFCSSCIVMVEFSLGFGGSVTGLDIAVEIQARTNCSVGLFSEFDPERYLSLVNTWPVDLVVKSHSLPGDVIAVLERRLNRGLSENVNQQKFDFARGCLAGRASE